MFGLGRTYATVVSKYGLLERLEFLVNVRYDLAGLALEKARLPKRILACQLSDRPHPPIDPLSAPE